MNTAIGFLFMALVIVDLMYSIAIQTKIISKRPDSHRMANGIYPLFAPVSLLLLYAEHDLSAGEKQSIQLHIMMLTVIIIIVAYFVLTGQTSA